jgi:anti-anti-sigma factor
MTTQDPASPTPLDATPGGAPVSTVALSGELDAYRVDGVEQALDQLSTRSDAEVDMSAVSFIDSSVLRVLIRQRERFDAAGRSFRLVTPSDTVRRLLEMSRLDAAFGLDSSDRS